MLTSTAMRLLRWSISVLATQMLAGVVLVTWLDAFETSGVRAILLGGFIITIISAAFWPVIYRLAAQVHPLIFPLLSFALTGFTLILAINITNWIDPGALVFESLGMAILVSLALTFLSTILGALFSLNDDQAYDWYVTQPLRHQHGNSPRSDVPGVLFLEIDGLSEPVLRDAVQQGYMPTLQRWLASGSHRLTAWEPDLSSQTSASQAGILLGNNAEIPAFRWWDKEHGKLMVSSSVATARALEARLSSGNGLLADDGCSRWNIFSGDAVDCLGTYSRIGASSAAGKISYYAYFSNPYTLSRTVGLFVADVIRERYQAHHQRWHDVQPRIPRSPKYALVRAATTVLLQEASRFMLTADILRGVPSVYCTFFAYDEVAHHSGIDRPDSLKVLATIDRTIAHLERVARDAPRPYDIVVLSDHGQSQGATFSQRYGQSIEALVTEIVSNDVRVISPPMIDEGISETHSALTEVLERDSRTTRLVRRLMDERKLGEEIDGMLADTAADPAANQAAAQADMLVLASGNLGLISFPQFRDRLSIEALASQAPDLIEKLRQHPGISFVMVRSDVEGGLVLGERGIYYLDHGYADGEDPLVPFGPNAAAHLRRTNSFSTAPDILVMSMFDPHTGEVAAFEELVGSHGGLGGPQTQPVVLFPAEWTFEPDSPIVGAEQLHRVLLGWLPHATPSESERPLTQAASSSPAAGS